MKITVIIPSRGRSHNLFGVVNALHSLASGENDIEYGIACDADDPATIGIVQIMQAKFPLAYRVSERGPSLGGMVNQMALDMPADVYLSLADDVLPLTPNWDTAISHAVETDPKGLWWWTPAFEQPVLYAIMSEKWRAAMGRMFTDLFPFWFDDLWLAEVYVMATEGPLAQLDIKIGDFPLETHRMRDLGFWHDFFHATRPQRLAEAKMIAEALGLPIPTVAEGLAERMAVINQHFVDQTDKIEAGQGEKSPPTPEYILAKARAELMMNHQQAAE